MRRLWFVVFAFLLSLCVTAVALEEAGVVFSDLAGQVEVRPGDDEEAWEFAKMERKLYTDDHVKTGLDSSAILSFADMSTFVMKPSTEIILSSPSKKESKVILAAGNIWVNVKKMVKDGSMDIEMSQAVAGIKGTNITCQTNPDGSEDRIQVLRGIAEVLIRESQERVTVNEGEELVVKKGGKAEKIEIDVQQEQEKWKDQLGRMGESIQLNEVPDVLRQIQQSENETFKVLQDSFKSLLAMESVPEDLTRQFRKEAERFIGVLMEDSVILSSIHLKVTNGLSSPDIDAATRVRLVGYQKMIADARVTLQRYQNEASKMMKTPFKKASTSLETELMPVQESLNAAVEPITGILQELSGNPSGMGQDWFASSRAECIEALGELDTLSAQVAAALEKSPADVFALALQKQISQQRTRISQMLKDLAVVEVDPSTITEMQDLEDTISDSILQLQTRINSYNAIGGESLDVQKRQLAESLHILNNFSAARRNYLNSQRLYDSTMRAAASQKFRTAEQEELANQFERISNKFSELGIVAEQLEMELNHLEDQINGILK